MLLVAVCMVALIAMAALSIDVVTLYLGREEAQRSADAAALAAARVISLSGITGTANPGTDTTAWAAVCGTSGTATQVAQQVAAINAVAGRAPITVNVTYSAQGATGGVTDCSTGLAQAFAINPTVTVQVKQTGLPTLFSRIWSRSTNSVSATATAEVFNPSDSGTIAPGGDSVPVTPRCVKPWIIPDEDPGNAGKRWVSRRRGIIGTPGISPPGIIGENFTLANDCSGPGCSGSNLTTNPPGVITTSPQTIYYVPALISTTPAVAVPSCATDDFQNSIAGCDQSTVYACGVVNGAQADLSANRGGDTSTAVGCLTNIPTGNDTLDTTAYPFQIKAGPSNPIASPNQVITSSNSIMTIPIYNDWMGAGSPQPLTGLNPQITILGFLQVFVRNVDSNGNMQVTVLNVSGCGDTASSATPTAPGSSPVPIRLITPQ